MPRWACVGKSPWPHLDTSKTMDTTKARKLFEEYAPAMAYVCVRNPDGTEGIGSAFHVGDGVFVTARHVVDQKEILEVATTENQFVPAKPEKQSPEAGLRFVTPQSFAGTRKLIAGPFFHPDDKVDVAVFVTEKSDQPVVHLGSHLDDWLGTQLVLTSAVVMGYPPVPMSTGPVLIAARAEINAIIDPYHAPHPRFILSAMSRGGFSGGLALSELNFALGVITESLGRNAEPVELGFLSVLSIEPIYACLSAHKVLPEIQKKTWGDMNFWDDVSIHFSDAGIAGAQFDGKRYTSGGDIAGTERENSLVVRVRCSHSAVQDLALEAVKKLAATWEETLLTEHDTGAIEVRWPALPERHDAILDARAARLKIGSHLQDLMSSATDVLLDNGYRKYGTAW